MTFIYNRQLLLTELINPLEALLFQLSTDELIGKDLNQLKSIVQGINLSQAEVFVRYVQSVADSGNDAYFEYRSANKDGSSAYAMCYAELCSDGLLYVNVRQVNENSIGLGHRIFIKDKELEQQRVFLKAAQNIIPVGLELYDRTGALCFINPCDMKIFGIKSASEVLGKNLFDDPNTPDDIKVRTRAGETLEYVLEYDFGLANEKYFNSQMSGVRTFKIQSSPILDVSGQIDGFILTNRDITEEVTRAHELTESKRKTEEANLMLVNILKQAPCVMFIKDVEDNYRYVVANELFCNYLNKKEQEVVGKTDFELIAPHEADQFRKDDQRIVNNNQAESYIEEVDWGGRHIIWHTTKTTLTTSNGQKFIMGISLDITDSTRTSELLDSVIRQIPLGLFIKDIDDDYRYLIVNEALSDIDGVAAQTMIGHTDMEVFPPETAQKFRVGDEAVVNSFNGQSIMQLIPNLHGETKVYEVTNSVLRVADGRRLLLGLVTDVTIREESVKQLQRAKENAEQSDKLKSAFLANMSHEIRTPLNSIVGFSDLLVSTDSTEDRQQYNDIISHNSELLLHLINDILDLSKLEAGIMEWQPEWFDLSEVFEEVYTMMGQRKQNNEVKLLKENPYTHLRIFSDRNRLKQVGINFLTNAIKYTPSGSIKMGYVREGNGVRIYVIDSGVGIDPSKRERVFQRFEKLDSFVQGTGLGLSICKAIMDRCKGKIGFESDQGKGSTFWAWFPCEVEP